MVPKSGHRWARGERDRLIVEMAAAQHGVVGLHQLVAVGLGERAVRARAAAGRLHRVHEGVYAVGRPDLPLPGQWTAAVLACGYGAVLSHRSAAALHGLLHAGGGAIDVLVPRRVGLSRPGIRVHRSLTLTAADRDEVQGIPSTSVPRTLLDLAATAPRRLLERACNQAEIIEALEMRAVDELVERSRGRPGIRRLRAVLGTGNVGSDRTRTRLESRFLALCRRAGLPRPSINEWMAIEGEELQCDFVWHRERVAVEVDGWATHRTRHAFQDDRRRDQLLRLAGWAPVRFTWDDVSGRTGHVVEVVATMLRSASS